MLLVCACFGLLAYGVIYPLRRPSFSIATFPRLGTPKKDPEPGSTAHGHWTGKRNSFDAAARAGGVATPVGVAVWIAECAKRGKGGKATNCSSNKQ